MEGFPISCHHENDLCGWVLVARPHIPSIEHCNKDPAAYLYKEPIDAQKAVEQFDNMVHVLQRLGVNVIDVSARINYDNVSVDKTGNLLFMRDPLLSTRKGVVMGQFKELVRREENHILMDVLQDIGIEIQGRVIREDSYIEGGDFIPAGDVCFIGTGNRTNIHGVKEMMSKRLFGTDRVAVVNYPKDGDMHAIHLDCYMGLVGHKVALVWEDACINNKVTVDEYLLHPKHGYILQEIDVPIEEYLLGNGWGKVIRVPTESQRNYGCNILDLGDGFVLTQDEYVTECLRKEGFKPIYIPYDEIHKMYGGIRCTTQVIHRDPLS